MARGAWTISGTAALVAAIVLISACRRDSGPDSSTSQAAATSKVVLYCATDREIAQDLIDQFEKETFSSVRPMAFEI
jgi:ABC-type glycerol-3-phosphate transport system substrate-binding protein